METLSARLDEHDDLVFPFDRPVTAEEWGSIIWPPCPRCGATLLVDRIEATALQQRIAHYLPGRIACPNEHDWRRIKPES